MQTLPQFDYGPKGTPHFAPGDTVEFTDVLNADVYFASITDYNLCGAQHAQPRAEACPLTVAARKTDACPWTCIGKTCTCIGGIGKTSP